MDICIAGEAQVAIEAVAHLLSVYPEHRVMALKEKEDRETRNWQRALSEDPRLSGLQLVDEHEVSEKKELIIVSINYPIHNAFTRFRSRKLFKIHFSLLPKYRGYHTSSWPILNGELQSGTTLCMLDSGIDSGDIVDQNIFYIYGHYTAKDVLGCHIDHGLRLFKANLGALVCGTFKTRRQPAIGATFYAKDSIDFANIAINFHATAHQVSCQIRAYILTIDRLPTFHGLAIYGVEILNTRSGSAPGALISSSELFLDVATVDLNVRLSIGAQHAH